MQPKLGAPRANQAVFLALMQSPRHFMGLELAAGGHLTHGAPVNVSGKVGSSRGYNVRPDTT